MRKENMTSNVNICYAVDENYAPYLKVALFSLLKNRNRNYAYNIYILYTELPEAKRNEIAALVSDEKDTVINFLDVTEYEDEINCEVGSYLSKATNYRLLLLSEAFGEYDKMLYLDCDIIVEGDVSELYFKDTDGMMVAAVEETGFRQMSYSKKAVFINGSLPYNVDNYRTDALKMKCPDNYFNAGVVLFDLQKCRERISFDSVIKLLHGQKYHYNDQDILNILFDGQVKMLDYEWNYQNNIEFFCHRKPEVYGRMYEDVKREQPRIIHYVSSQKPWNHEVMLGERYRLYEALCMKG